MATIALDYDGTYTDNPKFWLEFVKDAIATGYSVYCVTDRTAAAVTDDSSKNGAVDPKLRALVHVIACSGKPKLDVTKELNIKVDIWIDNHPETIEDGIP